MPVTAFVFDRFTRSFGKAQADFHFRFLRGILHVRQFDRVRPTLDGRNPRMKAEELGDVRQTVRKAHEDIPRILLEPKIRTLSAEIQEVACLFVAQPPDGQADQVPANRGDMGKQGGQIGRNTGDDELYRNAAV